MQKATVRIRPLRFTFVIDPHDLNALLRVFAVNSVLWGGAYNFILPSFKRVPRRYRRPYEKEVTASGLSEGFLETFQPDFLVEVKSNAAAHLKFPRDRVISFEQLLARNDQGRCSYGVDLRSVVAHLYKESFRFVQRHPPEAVLPSCADRRYELLFAAMFGVMPDTAPFSDCADHFLKGLEGQRKTFSPEEYPKLLSPKYLYPLNLGISELETRNTNWSIDSKLYYMDERSPLDLIDYWNLSALGWDITPLPASIAPKLSAFCEEFVEQAYRPFPPPSNAHHHASFMCSPNFTQTELQGFISSLKRNPQNPAWSAISLDPRVPRIWEEWGRSADHAEPQTIIHADMEVDAYSIGNTLDIRTTMPKFLEEDQYASQQHACANVFQSLPDGAPVIPWATGNLPGLIPEFPHEKTWLSREGIVTTSAQFPSTRFLQSPTSLNVFSAFAKGKGFELMLSPAGNICHQMLKALGHIRSTQIVARSPEFLKFLNSLASEDVEVESEGNPGKKLRKPYAPYAKVQEMVSRSTAGRPEVARENFFNALVNTKVLTVGLTLRCSECAHRSWHTLDSIRPVMNCPRCLSDVPFPSACPPRREEWAYKIRGPFAAANFAHGAYGVLSTLHFLAEHVLGESTTWVPSFTLKSQQGKEIEADFGVFARPSRFTNATTPFLVLGECKSFNLLESEDFAKARYLAKAFPGAVLCFSTFRETFTSYERKMLTRIVRWGRQSLRTGKIRTPVLILTGKELFSQFSFRRILYEAYGERSQYAHSAFLRRDVEELCSFMQETHLGIESYYSWLQEKSRKRNTRTPAIQAIQHPQTAESP